MLRNVQASQGSSYIPPPPCWVVPFARNGKFVDREHISNIKRKLFAKNGSQKLAIVGLGGVGKTQIALEVAYQARQLFPDCAILWVPAVDMESLEQAYQEIASSLGLRFDPKTEDVKKVVQAYLTQSHQGRWLMIFDNADELNMWTEDTSSSQYGGLRSFLPKSDQGAVIFTTRSTKVAQYLGVGDVFRIAELDEQKATKVLHNSLERKSLLNDTENTRQLLESLTYLPLAIVQAASFMNENEMSIASYVKLLDGQDQDVINLLSEEFEDEGRYKSIRNPVAITWLTSFVQINRDYPSATFYMFFMSCINSKDIPLRILPSHPPSDSSTAPGPLEQQKAIGVLISYSFLRSRNNGTSFDMHRLVHLATKNWLRSHGTLLEWQRCVIGDILAGFPSFENPIERRETLPHALHVLRSISHADEPLTKGWVTLFVSCARAVSEDGRIKEAIELLQNAVKYSDEVYGPESVNTIQLYADLGSAYNNGTDFQKSIQTCQRALDKHKEIRGCESPLTISLQMQQTIAYRMLRDSDKAEEICESSLRAALRIYAIDDFKLISIVDEMASVYMSQGRIYEAEKLAFLAYDLAKRFLKPGHPWRSAPARTLALCYHWQNKIKQAEMLYAEVLEAEERALGPEHNRTLVCKYHLARILNSQKQHEAAIALLTETARLQSKVLGPDHHETVQSYMALEEWTSNRYAPHLFPSIRMT